MDWAVSAFLLDCKTDYLMNLIHDVRWVDLLHCTSCTVGNIYNIPYLYDE
jgi:hypothetical protein